MIFVSIKDNTFLPYRNMGSLGAAQWVTKNVEKMYLPWILPLVLVGGKGGPSKCKTYTVLTGVWMVLSVSKTWINQFDSCCTIGYKRKAKWWWEKGVAGWVDLNFWTFKEGITKRGSKIEHVRTKTLQCLIILWWCNNWIRPKGSQSSLN